MKFLTTTVAALLTMSSLNVFACGDEDDSNPRAAHGSYELTHANMTCSPLKAGGLSVQLVFSWASCSSAQKVFISRGDITVFFYGKIENSYAPREDRLREKQLPNEGLTQTYQSADKSDPEATLTLARDSKNDSTGIDWIERQVNLPAYTGTLQVGAETYPVSCKATAQTHD